MPQKYFYINNRTHVHVRLCVKLCMQTYSGKIRLAVHMYILLAIHAHADKALIFMLIYILYKHTHIISMKNNLLHIFIQGSN